jgi:phosphoesterase RecJ-like protein
MYKEILDLIKNNDKFVITSHVNPDGDSIGSEIALFKYLLKQGKNARIISYSETPDNYLFLDGNSNIEKFDESRHNMTIDQADVIFILDTNEYSRLRTMEQCIRNSPAKKVCIDHHLGKSNGFDYSVIDTDSPATGEILFKIFTFDNKQKLDSDIAIPLYAAIMTDTGSFRFPRTDSETHKIIAELIDSGADPVEIYSEVYDKAKIGRLKLLSRFLSNIVLLYDDKVAYSNIYLNDLKETGTNVFDTEGFSHYIMSMAAVQIGIIFTQSPRGVKISFRSKDEIYANELAKEFGGGGHMNAAGAWVNGGNMESLAKEVTLKAKKYIK